MTRTYPLLAFILLCGSAQAQMSLSDQINAVGAAQEQERARQEASQHAVAEQAARAVDQLRAAQVTLERQRFAAQRAAHDETVAAQKAAHDEIMADKTRNQNYEDQMRSLQIEQGKLQVFELQQKVTADKKRDQAYEDQLRQLEIKQKMADLRKMETRAAREDDFIDRDLKHQDANTDVVQSDADTKRALSGGTKSLLEDVGTAGVKRESRPTDQVVPAAR